MPNKKVVVTGMGALSPIGLSVPEFWENLLKGTSGANPITHFDASSYRTQFACELKGFKATDYLDRKEARKMDPFCQYAMVAAEEAMKDADFDLEKTDLDRFGVTMGSGIGGLSVFYDEVKAHVKRDENPRFNPFFIPKMIIDIAAGQISIKYGLRGPNYASVSACATSSNCIIDAYMLISMGYADAMLAGGAEAAITPVGIGGFNAMRALSERNDDYATASRPFDKDRDGFVMGEGAACLVLESYEHAVARGAKIYAELAGIGLSADAHHITAPPDDGHGAKRVMQNLLKDAGVEKDEVDYINVHGTSTPLGDISETNAIKDVFGEHAYKLNISSTKSMTGHLLGAAGGVEAIACVMAVKNNIVPPTINHFTDDPECDLNYTFHKAQEREVRVAISNTFGFGGHNASLLFKKCEA